MLSAPQSLGKTTFQTQGPSLYTLKTKSSDYRQIQETHFSCKMPLNVLQLIPLHFQEQFSLKRHLIESRVPTGRKSLWAAQGLNSFLHSWGFPAENVMG